MSDRRLLLVFAHPDDESFGMGGTIAKYVAQGVDVYYLCATNGDVGTIPDEMKGAYPTIKELRLAELDCASKKLGFKQVFLGGYKDSGMMGSETTKDPESLWYQWQNTPEKVTRHVVEIIRQVQPQVVVTFNKYGGYGHPDHIAIQQATVKAFHLAGDSSYLTGEQLPYQPQKLYYTAIPTFMLRLGLFWIRLWRQDPRKLGTNKDIDLLAIFENIEPAHTKVNISDYLEIWTEANRCHASQGGGSGGFRSFIPGFLRRMLSGTQSFTRVFPAPIRNRIDESDLFEGTKAEPLREMAR
jgi:LmbE family N-acetylglucosaminyl deacetylase